MPWESFFFTIRNIARNHFSCYNVIKNKISRRKIMTLRNERVRKALMKEIADILQKEIRDTRISGIISIMDVEISNDNSFAKVYYSVFGGNEEDKEKTIEAIKLNTPKIRYEVGKRIRLRLTPELRFVYDDSMDRGAKINELIEKISRGEV